MLDSTRIKCGTRDLIIGLTGVAAAALLMAGGAMRAAAAWTLGVLLFLGFVCYVIRRIALSESATVAVYALEGEVLFLLCPALICILAAVFTFMWWAFQAFIDDPWKFLAGVGTGLIIPWLRTWSIFTGVHENWFAAHTKKRLQDYYIPDFFLYFDPDVGEFIGNHPSASWEPGEQESLAIQEDSYEDKQAGRRVNGWGRKERLARARTLTQGLR